MSSKIKTNENTERGKEVEIVIFQRLRLSLSSPPKRKQKAIVTTYVW